MEHPDVIDRCGDRWVWINGKYYAETCDYGLPLPTDVDRESALLVLDSIDEIEDCWGPVQIVENNPVVERLAEAVGIGGGFVTKDSGQRTEFASGMVRDVSDGKTKWHLLTGGPMLRRWAELLTRGAAKYSENNWMLAEGKAELKRFRESAFRHFMQWFLGDGDGEDHAAAIMFNVNGAEYVKAKGGEK